MRKKIVLSIFIIILLFQVIVPVKANAFVEKTEITSTPAQLERYKTSDGVNESTGVDTITGLMLEPTVEFFTVVIDSIASILTSFMTPNDFEAVMISYDDLAAKGLTVDTENPEEGITQFRISAEDMENYRGVFRGIRDKIS